MKKYYFSLNENKRILFWTIVGGISAFILSSFCFFIGLYDIPLGIILGTLISILNFLILEKQTIKCFSTRKPGLTTILFFLLRMLIYSLGLVLAIVLEKYWFPLFEVFAVIGGYILHKIILLIYGTGKGLRDGKENN